MQPAERLSGPSTQKGPLAGTLGSCSEGHLTGSLIPKANKGVRSVSEESVINGADAEFMFKVEAAD